MPRYRFKGPDGKSFVVNAPEGASKDQAIAIARKHIATIQPKDERGPLRKVDDFVRGVADAATLGYSDEIAAKLGSLTGLGGEKDNYEGNLQRQRQRDSQGGGQRLAGQIAGAVALPTSKLTAAKGLKGVGASAAEGAAYGAAYGSGSAEGDRVQGAKSGAIMGAGGGAAGRVAGNAAARAMRGRQVSPAVRQLHNEGVVMTPGQRGGPVKRALEEGVLGSLPLVKSIPQAAKRRGVEQMNVAAYNRALKPLDAKLPMSTQPGKDAIAMVGDTIFSAYDDAASRLALGMDKPLDTAVTAIRSRATAAAGPNAKQLGAIIDETLEPLRAGPLTGSAVRDLLQDLRGEASGFMTSAVKSEQRVGKQLWQLHDQLEATLVRQNKSDVLTPFKKAREAVNLFKRVESAAAKSPDGVFNPQQFRTAVTKRGYGTTVGKVARGDAPMQDLADAAKQVLPNTLQNSGTPERMAGLAALGGPGAVGAFVDPTMGLASGAALGAYAPGLDRILQNLALNRPDMFRRGGNALSAASPALGTAGAFTAINQGR
jgi:hypothetical protein